MPTYEYLCGACDHEFEREQRITEEPIKTCPACKSRKARRLISRTSFVLKGGGWYSDLYSSPSSSKNQESSKDGDSKSSTEVSDKAKSDKKSSKKTSESKSAGSKSTASKPSGKTAA